MKSSATTERIVETLSTQYPNADTELNYRNAFELLVATMLSAQSTDARVNLVTPSLFAAYPDAAALARAKTPALEKQILSTGFFRQKAKALVGMAKTLVDEHDGQVPANMDALTALPGVGRKTANVVLGHALGVPGLPVDRHVLRVANRIGIAEGDDPVAVEKQLCERLPRQMWTLASDVQILHGRRVCRPKPLCEDCSIRDECDFYHNEVGLPEPYQGGLKAATTKTKAPGGLKAAATKTRAPGGLKAAATKTNGSRRVRTSRR